MKQLSVSELAAWMADAARPQPLMLDVREPWEVATAAISGTVNIPMREVPARLAELEPGREIVAICHHGGRSQQVALFLEHHGRVTHNLAGGIDAWSRDIDGSVPRY